MENDFRANIICQTGWTPWWESIKWWAFLNSAQMTIRIIWQMFGCNSEPHGWTLADRKTSPLENCWNRESQFNRPPSGRRRRLHSWQHGRASLRWSTSKELVCGEPYCIVGEWLVGGLEHEWYFPYIGNNDPTWLSYFSEGLMMVDGWVLRHFDGVIWFSQSQTFQRLPAVRWNPVTFLSWPSRGTSASRPPLQPKGEVISPTSGISCRNHLQKKVLGCLAWFVLFVLIG